jgi:hypothetical protein
MATGEVIVTLAPDRVTRSASGELSGQGLIPGG